MVFQRKEGLPPFGALEAGNLQSAPVAVNGQVYSIEVAKEADYNSMGYKLIKLIKLGPYNYGLNPSQVATQLLIKYMIYKLAKSCFK